MSDLEFIYKGDASLLMKEVKAVQERALKLLAEHTGGPFSWPLDAFGGALGYWLHVGTIQCWRHEGDYVATAAVWLKDPVNILCALLAVERHERANRAPAPSRTEAAASVALDHDPDMGTHSVDDGCPGGHREQSSPRSEERHQACSCGAVMLAPGEAEHLGEEGARHRFLDCIYPPPAPAPSPAEEPRFPAEYAKWQRQGPHLCLSCGKEPPHPGSSSICPACTPSPAEEPKPAPSRETRAERCAECDSFNIVPKPEWPGRRFCGDCGDEFRSPEPRGDEGDDRG